MVIPLSALSIFFCDAAREYYKNFEPLTAMPADPRPPCNHSLTAESTWVNSSHLRMVPEDGADFKITAVDKGAFQLFFEDDVEGSMPMFFLEWVYVGCVKTGLCSDLVTKSVDEWIEYKDIARSDSFAISLQFVAKDHEIAGCICYLRALLHGQKRKKLYVEQNVLDHDPDVRDPEDPVIPLRLVYPMPGETRDIKTFCTDTFTAEKGNDGIEWYKSTPMARAIYAKYWFFV